MSPRFWDEPPDDDKSLYEPVYVLNRDSKIRQDVRDFVEDLWSRYEPYCGDENFLAEARRHFNQFTWQMYVGVCILAAGHTLEKAAPTGPDHKATMAGRRVWIECIAPEAGEGDNVAERTIQSWTKTELGGHGMFRPPPDDKIAARLTGAILNKVQQHRKWVTKGIVPADDPFIIAIGGGLIPDADLDRDLPHIVHALFGLGDSALTYEVGSEEPAKTIPTYRDEIKRVVKTDAGDKEAPISLRGFLDETLYPEVSAVICCGHGVWNPPRKIGRDLVTVYNAVAKRSLPPGTVPLGREYWAEQVVRSRDNREDLPEPEPDEETKKAVEDLIAKDNATRKLSSGAVDD